MHWCDDAKSIFDQLCKLLVTFTHFTPLLSLLLKRCCHTHTHTNTRDANALNAKIEPARQKNVFYQKMFPFGGAFLPMKWNEFSGDRVDIENWSRHLKTFANAIKAVNNVAALARRKSICAYARAISTPKNNFQFQLHGIERPFHRTPSKTWHSAIRALDCDGVFVHMRNLRNNGKMCLVIFGSDNGSHSQQQNHFRNSLCNVIAMFRYCFP